MHPKLPLRSANSLLVLAVCLSALFFGNAATTVSTTEAAGYERTLLRLHNKARKKKNRPKLRFRAPLKRAAKTYALDMATTGVFSHVGADGSVFDKRIRDAGGKFSTMGENIALGQPSANAVHRAWMKSPGHRRNILNRRYKYVGFGKGGTEPYWVSTFGG